MNVTVVVATCGDMHWRELAQDRAKPSAEAQTEGHPNRWWVQPHYPHETVAGARNRAVHEHVESDWICFLDADDELEPGYLDAMDAANDGWVYPPVTEPFTTGAPPLLVPQLRRVHTPPWRIEGAAIPNQGRWPKTNECVIGTLVHRRLFEQEGGFRDRTDDGTPIDLYEDWDLWLRCWEAGAERVYTDAVYREHVNPIGRNYSPTAQATYDAIWRDHEARMKRGDA